MACLRLVTRPPLPPFPDFRVPRFSRCIALFTLLLAAWPYFLRDEDFLAGIFSLRTLERRAAENGCEKTGVTIFLRT
jgi:hypothetical protein